MQSAVHCIANGSGLGSVKVAMACARSGRCDCPHKYSAPPTNILLCSTMTYIGLVIGFILGHAYKGRQFGSNIHAHLAPYVDVLFIGQIVFGIYLKFHFERGINKYIRRAAVMCHGTVGKLTPIVSWVQIGFGWITLLGFCQEDHLGQVCEF